MSDDINKPINSQVESQDQTILEALKEAEKLPNLLTQEQEKVVDEIGKKQLAALGFDENGNLIADDAQKEDDDQDGYMSTDLEKNVPFFPKVPTNVFPLPVQYIINQVSVAKAAPKEIVASSIRGLVSAIMGRYVELEYQRDWKEPCNQFYLIVAKSSEGKGPVDRIILKYYKEKQKGLYDLYKEEKKEYDQKSDDEKKEIDEPKPCILSVKMVTEEKLIVLNESNNRNLTIATSEYKSLLSLIHGKYSKDESMAATLNDMFDCESLSSYKMKGDVVSDRSCLTLIGQVQPAVLFENVTRNDLAIGFMQRCTPLLIEREENDSGLKHQKPMQKDVLTDDDFLLIKRITDNLFQFTIACSVNDHKTVYFTQDAWDRFYAWQENNNKLAALDPKNTRFADRESFYNKQVSKALRTILGLHCLICAVHGTQLTSEIGLNTTEKGLLLANYDLDCVLLLADILDMQSGKESPKVTGKNPIIEGLKKAFISFESELDKLGNRIPNDTFCNRFREISGLNQMSNTSIGRNCSTYLGIKTSNSGGRFRLITKETISAFKSDLSK